jgi:ABC-2 type transport system permease protein
MTLATFRLELRRDRTLTLWLGIIAFAYAGTMAIFYPLMKENVALLEEYMELFPEEFLIAFGMTGSLADPGVFFTTYVGSYVWPIVAAIGAILLATRPVAADQDRGFLELPLSTPMPRVRYLAVAVVGQILVLAILAVAMMAGVIVLGILVDAGLDAGRMLLVIPSALAFGCAIAAVATLLSVITLSRGVAGGLTAGILIAMYLLNVVAQLQPDLDWLARLSAFHYFDTTAIIDEGLIPWSDIAVHTVAALVAWVLALALFRRRDLAA